ncbi:MAG: hypothetical protein H6718_21835 [Polyangiaceae bacterium]|nr:hypothetical protein [Myxococcales bacterium]MCB9588063.1 hypothetical protein [Polyangiaceae bacterium]
MRGAQWVLRRPIGLWVSSAGLMVVGALGVGLGGLAQPAYGACCLVAGFGPWWATSGSRERSVFLAYAVLAWSLFGLMPMLMIGEALGGPYGGPPWRFALGLLASLGRLISFAHPQTKAWLLPRI